jgi:tetratricopeptide (TPR) repeat protein
MLGAREPDTENLQSAVAACQDALKEYTRERIPLDWAMAQYNLGNALQFFGERESNTENVKRAVTSFQDALRKFRRERVPLQWAMAQSSLGITRRQIRSKLRTPDPQSRGE